MPYIIRERKDIIDLRPIRMRQGPRSYSYCWKLLALLELNEDGQFVLPFSQRLVHIERSLWNRQPDGFVPEGYEECGCIGCENKSYADHILNDDSDDGSENGNLHIEEVYIESGNEQDDKFDEKAFDENSKEQSVSESSTLVPSSTSNNDCLIYHTEDNNDTCIDSNNQHDSSSELMLVSSSCSTSPFPCDPYESFDWENSYIPFLAAVVAISTYSIMSTLNEQRKKRSNDASENEYQELQQMNKSVVKQKKYFLHFICTKEGKYVLPFSRRPVDIDLQRLIDEHNACLSTNHGRIDFLVNWGPVDPNKKVIRITDEQWTERDIYNLIK